MPGQECRFETRGYWLLPARGVQADYDATGQVKMMGRDYSGTICIGSLRLWFLRSNMGRFYGTVLVFRSWFLLPVMSILTKQYVHFRNFVHWTAVFFWSNPIDSSKFLNSRVLMQVFACKVDISEASLILNRVTDAKKWYMKAAGKGRIGNLVRTRHQARLLLDHMKHERQTIEKCFKIPRIAFFCDN